MYSYAYNKTVNAGRLSDEVKTAGLSTLHHIGTAGDTVTIVFSDSLSVEQKSTLDLIVTNHVAVLQQDVIRDRILKAMEFGRIIIADYGAQNVVSGYSVEQINDIIGRVGKVLTALNTGSLYIAIDELNKVQLDETLITAEKVKSVRNKIEDYLGLPRT